MFLRNKISNRKVTLALGLVIFLFYSLAAKGYTAEKDSLTELYGKAGKEGKVVFYSTMQVQVTDDLAKNFEKKYPGIQVEIYRSVSETLMNKALSEARAKKYLWDVIHFGVEKVDVFKKLNLFATYRPSSYSFYKKGLIDPEGYWTSPYHSPCTVAYNTKMVKASEVPNTWEGLLDPKWKGKIAMDRTKYFWFIFILDYMGEEKGVKYLKELAAQKIIFGSGITQTAMLMAAGEFPLMGWSYATSIEKLKRDGAPLDWVRMKSPVNSECTILAVGEQAPHPNAARLLDEFILSKEGQEVLVANDTAISRTDVENELAKELNKLEIRLAKGLPDEEFARQQKLFRSIFGL